MKPSFAIFVSLISFIFSLTKTLNTASSLSQKEVDDVEVLANACMRDQSTNELFNQLTSNIDDETYIDNTYASYYFSNLRDNFGNNAFGSCGYVSIGMLLSFYDVYWDDSIIENSYDVVSNYSIDRQPLADFYLVPTNAESPGIKFEPSSLFSNATVEEYLSIATENKDTYFQFELFDLSKQYFGIINFDEANGNLGLSGEDIYELVDYYIHDYKNNSDSEVVVNLYDINNAPQMKSNVVNNIKEGNPVIIVVRQPNTSKAHSVIAYDYDSSNQEIYVHTGWRNENSGIALTHVSLSDLGYTEIVSAVTLEVNSEKNLGQKYFSQSGEGSSSSTFIFPREIELTSGNYADMIPTFSRKSLYSEKREYNKDPYFNFSVLNLNRISVFEVTNIRSLSYILTTSQWEKVRFDISGKKYYVLLTLNSNTYPYWDDYWCRVEFTKPNSYLNRPYIVPKEYGFADAYPTDESTKTQFESHTIRGFTFETRRYRVGYIHNEDIVMSPIKKGINEAFIEYRFETALKRIDVDLSHWREQSSERLTSSNGIAVIQQYIEDEWVTVLDLLASETNLPRNRNNKNTYKIEFVQPAYRVRFYSKYSGVSSGESNKGRICIGNMAFYESDYNLPLSGSELDYMPDTWNNTVVNQFLRVDYYLYQYTNCYSYAVNAQVNPTTNSLKPMQPGQANGKTISMDDLLNTNKVVSAIESDANILGFGFDQIDANEPCPDGTYKVAFVIDNQYSIGDGYQYDYHWYRQNSDGTWSHKPGTTPVKNIDSDGKLIMDPRTCDRDSGNGLNYNLFVGFYAVRPLNTVYSK